jgi:hypothetical protein
MTVANDLAVRRALELAGVEFIDENGGDPGLRLRKRKRAKPVSDRWRAKQSVGVSGHQRVLDRQARCAQSISSAERGVCALADQLVPGLLQGRGIENWPRSNSCGRQFGTLGRSYVAIRSLVSAFPSFLRAMFLSGTDREHRACWRQP